MKIKGSKAYQEFVKARSRAFGEHFDEFVQSRDLDIDDKYWSEQDKADFNVGFDALLAEWALRKAELLAAEEAAQNGES
ncbi:hypothetical protein [Nocardia arthritidis]|uniref:Uncharacterized protein n=1 Tax=Nocardia arthritidis TaxID=228602 RepID=A0A6G9YSW6_9NOCA|nr:hypothetical protein [Nocardia arthritidis]QIS16096.1 hypothetical protein F5544_41430 [Nocardia arthritidis]